ncbi:hypothetical protein PR003_g15929 [Phytophthora rubi]|uniref:Uncharacterized protein n=1 Tax=Phytophthora rubi TaxID=129364 RepID=A0A6A3LE34_9STRA|nr:hypothetical protein PR002_g13688 [Phytophthora rubi]KAE9023220.1 hypothetical protein PR001_g12967 [Phytophthora rubi]KAE9327824.1 hypothetical protein PR003_g15929 [Phytophthora rubi]
MAPALRHPRKKKPGRPKTRKTTTCWRCHLKLSTSKKLKQHLLRKTGCGPKAVALQKERRKFASRLTSKVYSIKRELDKVGWWEAEAKSEDEDEETKDDCEDEDMEDAERVPVNVWVTAPDNLKRAKALARVDWSTIVDLR